MNSEKSTERTSPPCKRRGVHFSAKSNLVPCEPPSTAECEKWWYTADEQAHHKEILLQDILAARRLLAVTSTQGLTDGHIHHFLGMEQYLLSPEFARRAIQDKRRHTSLIISQQGRWQEQELCEISTTSSRLARERAYVSAANNWAMSKERGVQP